LISKGVKQKPRNSNIRKKVSVGVGLVKKAEARVTAPQKNLKNRAIVKGQSSIFLKTNRILKNLCQKLMSSEKRKYHTEIKGKKR
jgi:hypothetical protein